MAQKIRCQVICSYQLPTDFWAHQTRGVSGVIEAIAAGQRRIVLTSPCGGGKTRMMTALIEWASSEWKPSALYTSRRMLFKQTGEVLADHGIEFGVRASGKKTHLFRDVQLCMTQSELSAVYKQKRRELHNAKVALIDEIHMQGGAAMQQIMQDHHDAGGAVVAFTATPLDLPGEWDRLIVAGTNSELRECGAHVLAKTYCPDEPDLKHIKKYKVGEDLTDQENRQAIMRPGVFGRVYDNWLRLNPEWKPTILFAPDVAGSIFFAEQFYKKGVRAAHIDAKQIWMDGEYYPSDDEMRGRVLAASEAGDIVVLCNRFVLREGIDLPHIAHCIMACVFGSLTTYLQSGGRVIRAYPYLTEVVVQDHGGNYVRHGSLNADRDWELGQSGYRTTGLRLEGMRERPDMEPIICPKCGMARLSGPTCHSCGHSCNTRSRMVVQINGELKEVEGPSFRPHRIKREPDTEQKWLRYYYGAKKKGRTFNQAAGYFFYNEHYWPPKDLRMMPRDPADWFEKVDRVPKERLL